MYDTIGMDPRGVGGSTQLLCDPHEEIALPSRPTEADLPKFAEAAKADADACAAGGGDLRKHITSMNTARDIDLIRRVLREEKISFLGYSYGTFLGPLYGEMFPDRVDRIVLDSAQDPRQTWREVEVDDVEANRANVSAWLAWTAERTPRSASARPRMTSAPRSRRSSGSSGRARSASWRTSRPSTPPSAQAPATGRCGPRSPGRSPTSGRAATRRRRPPRS
ncbi:alpha/beta fold hydrolase [Actinokineospora soli]|uniref:Alpha/beta fold hydrolase n=1 Tax=Actinokineospora soli TaxID=1048753 RepID=A0ABW2TXP0_9PSEU